MCVLETHIFFIKIFYNLERCDGYVGKPYPERAEPDEEDD